MFTLRDSLDNIFSILHFLLQFRNDAIHLSLVQFNGILKTNILMISQNYWTYFILMEMQQLTCHSGTVSKAYK